MTLGVASAGRRVAPTIRQVAALAGVSRATASRAINGGHLVSPQARAAVEAAVAELGFTPNPVARSLATRRTGSVALVLPEPNTRVLTDPFFASTINGMARALEHTDLQLVLLIARQDGWSTRTVRYLTTGHVDGAVVASHHRDDRLNRELVESGLPCVFIGRPLDVPATARYVDTDNDHAAQLATEHLIGLGRTRIGTIAGPADMSAAIDRLSGWRAAMGAAGLAQDAVELADFTVEGGGAAMARLIEAHPDLDAVFVASDLMASGAVGELSDRGVRVPEDVAVFGFDDLGVATTTTPALSTMGQPIEDMATRAGQILHALLAGEEVEEISVMFPARLVLRESA
ncbi:LacI family DNA-binding transcriptional regulator [Actinotalea sp. BY-33]|uniref:LacI family DNA-binding transcriptional regulator n=1 Tax=Actinotalea soli TaxID=2819234 RepID=A0A939LQ48_9CELL|nr:LacI family DNA-binding transcriptional regulator [Actinotalea soli]